MAPALLQSKQLSKGRRYLRLHSALPVHVHVGGLHAGCSPHTADVVVCVIAQGRCCHPGDNKEGPVTICGVTKNITGVCYLMYPR